MDKQQLKQTIDDNITTNGQNEITGEKLNDVLNDMVDSLGVVNQISVGTTTTGAAGTDASVTNSGTATDPVLNFTIPRGADGQDGADGRDGADAVNTFKGWWPDLATLKAAITAQPGDSAYVKDESPATTWSIYVYDPTASSDNYWADSGTDADTTSVQTFASGEEVNQVAIDDTHLSNPTQGSIPLALDVVGKLNQVGVTASAKDLIIALFRKCAFITDDAGDDIDDLEEEFEGTRVLVNITATMPQTYTIYDNQSVEILRDYLTVTAEYDDGSISTVTTYTLSGELTEGTSVITVSYGGLTTTVSVTVTIAPLTFTNNELLKNMGLSATYTNGGSAIPYCASNSKRVAYPYFDKLTTGGKTFTLSLTSSDSRTKVGLQCFTESALNKVANNQNIINASPGSPSVDGFDTGWISFSDGLATITIPEKSTSDALSVIRGIRVSMKVDDGSSGGATIPGNYTAELTITENNP